MTEAIYPQCRVVPVRLLKPETAERLLNGIATNVKGIRRMVINGPRLPRTVPYGPARGEPNPLADRRSITVGDQEIELEVQVGMVTMELEEEGAIEDIRKVCDEIFTEFSYILQTGRFMKTSPSTSDYAKYGPDADERILGLIDPRNKSGPVIIQGLK